MTARRCSCEFFDFKFMVSLLDLGIGVLENILEFLDFKTMTTLRLYVSRDVTDLCIHRFPNIPVSVKLTRMLPFRNPLGHRRPTSEYQKGKYFNSIMKAFPNIVSLSLFPSWIFYRCEISLLFLYVNDNLKKTLKLLKVTVMNDLPLEAISQLSNLTDLDIGSSYDVTGVGLVYISRLKNLKRLNLQCCLRLFDPDILALSSLRELEYLNLSSTYVGDDALPFLKSLKHLKTLSLNRCGNITDFGLNTLFISAPQLCSLDVGSTEITDEGMLIISQRSSVLKELTISNTSVTEHGLGHLLFLASLETLCMSGLKNIPRGKNSIFDRLTTKLDCTIYTA